MTLAIDDAHAARKQQNRERTSRACGEQEAGEVTRKQQPKNIQGNQRAGGMEHRFLVSELRWLAYDPLGQTADGKPLRERSAPFCLVDEILGAYAALENSGSYVGETGRQSSVETHLAGKWKLFAAS